MSLSQPTKKLIDVMRNAIERKRSDAELLATAWTALCHEEVKDQGALPPTGRWVPRYLEVPELIMCIQSTMNAHAGAPFPLEFPQKGAEMEVPSNLYRVNFHDYIGHHLRAPARPGEGHIEFSQAQLNTVDFRTNPHLCPACEYWCGSDSALKVMIACKVLPFSVLTSRRLFQHQPAP